MSTKTVSSNLDVSAAEFVPSGDLMRQLAKREALSKIKAIIDPAFSSNDRSFQSQLDQLFKLATLKCDVDPPQVIGYALGQATLESRERYTTGFRIFKELRALLPTTSGQGLEHGLLNAVHEETQAVVNGNILKELQLRDSTCCDSKSSGQREEAGDVPTQANGSPPDGLFTLVNYLTLLISRLNLVDSSDECTCVPPVQPCINLCKLTLTVCRMQLTCPKVPSVQHSHDRESPDEEAFDATVLTRRDWIGLLYLLIDSFFRSLRFFNYFLASLNQRITNGAWHRTGSLEEPTKISETMSEMNLHDGFDCGSYLSSLINNVLTCMRKLLLDERLPLKMIRSIVLDTLMAASEMSAISNMTYPTWPGEAYELPVTESGSTESEADEVYECYQKFLVETHQVPPS